MGKTVRIVAAALFVLAAVVVPAVSHAQTLPTAVADTSQSALTTNLGIFGGDTWDIAVDGDHVYTIASGVPNGFFYSTDAAATWQRASGTNDFGAGTAVEVDPTTHIVYVSLGGDLYKSTDFGVTLTKIVDNAGFALLAAQNKLLYAYNDVVHVSTDSGTTFSSVQIPGENIRNFASSATAGTFYAATQNSTTNASHLYVSTDSGATWNLVTVDAGVTGYTEVHANPSNANVLTLSHDNGLWLSTNAGVTWTDIGTTSSRPCGDYSVWTSSRWYACSGYSTNNGSTWTDMDVHTNVMRGPGKIVVVNAADETVLYGDCMSGICKSTDGGATWHNSLNGIAGVNVLAISQTTDKNTVWISSSNGLGRSMNFLSASPTWAWPILPCDARPGHRCDSSGMGESVWVKPDDANIVLAGSIGGWIYRSTDGGSTWTNEIPSVIDVAKFKTGSNNNLRPQMFVNDPTNTSIIYAALVDPVDHNGAVLKSTDAGITWTNLAITDDAPATVLTVTKGHVLFVGTGEGKQTTTPKGIYTYTNGTWAKLIGIDSRLNIKSVMVDPETQTTVYATASNDLAPLQLDGFYKSTDSGATWSKVVPNGYHGFGPITVQKSTSPNTLYISAVDNANHGVLLKSSDQGATWGTLYTGLKAESFTTVLFDGLVAGNKHGLFALKSKATLYKLASTTLKVKKNAKVTFTGILRDQATKKLLKGKVLGIYQLVGNTWKLKGTFKSNAKGAFSVTIKATKAAKYRLSWTPGKTDRIEYATYNSKTFSVTIKK